MGWGWGEQKVLEEQRFWSQRQLGWNPRSSVTSHMLSQELSLQIGKMGAMPPAC